MSDEKIGDRKEGPCEVPSCAASRRSSPAYQEDFYRRLIENLYDGVYFVDLERRITYWNRAAEQLTGYTAEEVMGRRCSDNLLVHTDERGVNLCLTRCPLSHCILDGDAREADVYLRHKQGHRVPVGVRAAAIRDEQGQIVGAVEVFNDNTAKRDAQHRVTQLEEMAFLDSLTRIPNRRCLEFWMQQVLEESRRYGRHSGLMLFDIDRFKQINDRHGHETGDAALMVTAQTLTRSLRTSDHVGRWGGDEFMAILPEVTLEGLRLLGERCRALIEQSIVIRPDTDLRIRVSVGCTLIGAEDSPESLLRRADRKLYESKQRGGNSVTVG